MEPSAIISVQDAQTEYMKKMLRHSRLRTLFTAVMTVIFLGLGVFALQAGAQLNRILYEAETTFSKLSAISAQIDEADVPGMIEQINVLVQDGQTAAAAATDSMQTAADKMEALDIDTLNRSIQDFAAVVEPLSRLFGR
jgi:N-acyl-L-homoserine lactone synthetase